MDISLEDMETIREFLVESHENLSRLDQDLVELEKHPRDAGLLGSIFRTIHTIKGACGFLAFTTLEKITHQAETLLSQLRDGKRDLNPGLVSLILETVDATRQVLASIEANGKEGDLSFEDLTGRLRAAAELPIAAVKPTASVVAEPTPAPPAVQAVSAPQAAVQPAKPEARPAIRLTPRLPKRSRTRGAPAKIGGRKRSGGRRKDGVKKTSNGIPPLSDSNIRVGVGLLDKLMDLVGELVLTRNQILQFNTEREDAALNATSSG